MYLRKILCSGVKAAFLLRTVAGFLQHTVGIIADSAFILKHIARIGDNAHIRNIHRYVRYGNGRRRVVFGIISL